MKKPGVALKAGEAGYALIAAVAVIAVFAALALAIGTATRISIASGAGDLARARADAAADAGLAIAEHDLAAGDEAMLALLHGRQREIEFAGSHLRVHVIDERGKIPLNHIEEDVITRMFQTAGLSGPELEIASDSLLDWLDDDDQPRPNGAESAYYAGQGIAPRNGGLASVDELARVRGVGPRLAERLRPYVTVDPSAQPFDPSYAQPQAVAAMSAGGDASADAGPGDEQVALDTTTLKDLINRPLTITVDADAPGGGHAHHEAVVVLTGKPDQPYLIHAVR